MKSSRDTSTFIMFIITFFSQLFTIHSLHVRPMLELSDSDSNHTLWPSEFKCLYKWNNVDCKPFARRTVNRRRRRKSKCSNTEGNEVVKSTPCDCGAAACGTEDNRCQDTNAEGNRCSKVAKTCAKNNVLTETCICSVDHIDHICDADGHNLCDERACTFVATCNDVAGQQPLTAPVSGAANQMECRCSAEVLCDLKTQNRCQASSDGVAVANDQQCSSVADCATAPSMFASGATQCKCAGVFCEKSASNKCERAAATKCAKLPDCSTSDVNSEECVCGDKYCNPDTDPDATSNERVCSIKSGVGTCSHLHPMAEATLYKGATCKASDGMVFMQKFKDIREKDELGHDVCKSTDYMKLSDLSKVDKSGFISFESLMTQQKIQLLWGKAGLAMCEKKFGDNTYSLAKSDVAKINLGTDQCVPVSKKSSADLFSMKVNLKLKMKCAWSFSWHILSSTGEANPKLKRVGETAPCEWSTWEFEECNAFGIQCGECYTFKKTIFPGGSSGETVRNLKAARWTSNNMLEFHRTSDCTDVFTDADMPGNRISYTPGDADDFSTGFDAKLYFPSSPELNILAGFKMSESGEEGWPTCA